MDDNWTEDEKMKNVINPEVEQLKEEKEKLKEALEKVQEITKKMNEELSGLQEDIDKITSIDREKLKELINQSLGEASMCWKPEPTLSLFDSTKCKDIGKKLYKDIIEKFFTGIE